MRLAILLIASILMVTASNAATVDLQGVLADWNCVKDMVRDGQRKRAEARTHPAPSDRTIHVQRTA